MHFGRRFNLIESKETDVLRDLEIALRLTDDPTLPQQPPTSSSASGSESHSQSNLLLSMSANSTTLTTETGKLIFSENHFQPITGKQFYH